jgi:hypothetical protein
MGVTVVEKGLRCFDRSPWSIISQRRDPSHDWKLRRVSAALPLKSTATCFRDLSPMPPQTLQGLEVAGQRAAVLALRDGYQGRRTYRRVGSAPRERREEELAGARRAIGLHANAVQARDRRRDLRAPAHSLRSIQLGIERDISSTGFRHPNQN